MLNAAHISQTYVGHRGKVTALDSVSLNVVAGEFVIVQGPSGSGKTTLLLAAGGLLKPGESAEVEMAFHFDYIFGDIEAAQDDHINTGSVGFDFFRLFAEGNTVDVTQEEMKKTAGYSTLVKAVWSLGHLGEGHCDVSAQSSKGEI